MSIQQVKNLINGEIIAKNISKIAWYMSIQHCHHYFWNYWNETQRIQAYKIKECRAWENCSKCDANCSPVVVFYLIKYGSISTVGQKILKSPVQRNSWNQINLFNKKNILIFSINITFRKLKILKKIYAND